MAVYKPLLADAKLTKYIPQYLIVGNLPSDVAQIVYAGTDVFGNEVGGDAVSKASLCFLYRFERFGECFVMAHIGHNHIVF